MPEYNTATSVEPRERKSYSTKNPEAKARLLTIFERHYRLAQNLMGLSATSAIHAKTASIEADAIASAKSNLFDTSSWREFCDVTLTLKQSHRADSGSWIEVDHYRCGQAFRHFMNLLNKAAYGSAFHRYGKRLRVLPVLEKGEVRARSLHPWERGTSGRWHIHCAIELPLHFDAFALERLIRVCWARVELSNGRILVRDCANAGWIHYMLKHRQKSEFDGLLDCVMIESLHNPIADA